VAQKKEAYRKESTEGRVGETQVDYLDTGNGGTPKRGGATWHYKFFEGEAEEAWNRVRITSKRLGTKTLQ